MTTAAPFEVEQFWDHLLAFVEEGRVIPVVGKVLDSYRIVRAVR